MNHHMRHAADDARFATLARNHVQHDGPAKLPRVVGQCNDDARLPVEVVLPHSEPRRATWLLRDGRCRLRDGNARSEHQQDFRSKSTQFHRGLLYGQPCCFASDAVASEPPSPMVSTADDGTMTIDPRSLIAS